MSVTITITLTYEGTIVGNLYNKTNAPYLIAGTLATLALLASGTLAVAPYVAFLSSIAAFNVALPVALSLSILSTLILVLSCKMISRNKKLAAQGAELNEKTELAAEQENTIQSLEPQIKGLNKKVSDLETKLDEISRQANGAATKDEVEELKAGLNGAAKDAVKKLIEDAAEELKKELEVKIGNAATKDEVKKLIEDAVKEVEVKEELQMKFYEKGKKRYKTTFDDVILQNEKKQELKEIYESQKESDAALKKGEGYILYGLPGTGKTMIAKAIASETKDTSAFISVSGSSLFNIKNIDDLFKKAEENAPCIVFIDEIEGFGKAYSSDDNVQYLKHFLTKIDGADHVKGVTVIAATNHIGILDKALVRGGRLGNHIEIPTLGTDTRKKIINKYCQKENLQSIAHTILNNTSEGFSPANLISLLKEIEGCASKVRDKTKTAAICRSFKRTHNIKKVSNKQTNRKIENSIGESQQYTSRPSHKLNDALCDSGYTSICSTLINS